MRSTTTLTAIVLLIITGSVGCNRSTVESVERDGTESPLERIAKRDGEGAHTDSYSFDFSLPSTDGQMVAKEDFAGRVLIVDIWGTWCPPCRLEVPHFVELQEEYEDQGLSVVGINYEGTTDPDEAREAIAEFTADIPVNYPLLIGDEATQAQVPNFNAFPTTLFIDREGEVRLTLIGARSKAELEQVVKILLDEAA